MITVTLREIYHTYYSLYSLFYNCSYNVSRKLIAQRFTGQGLFYTFPVSFLKPQIVSNCVFFKGNYVCVPAPGGF